MAYIPLPNYDKRKRKENKQKSIILLEKYVDIITYRLLFIHSSNVEREDMFYEAFIICLIQAVFEEILSYIRGLSTPEGPQAIRHEETPIRAH